MIWRISIALLVIAGVAYIAADFGYMRGQRDALEWARQIIRP